MENIVNKDRIVECKVKNKVVDKVRWRYEFLNGD